MDLKAIVMVGGARGGADLERLAGVPLAFLDVLGMPIVQRTVKRLQQFGISEVTIVSDAEGPAAPVVRSVPLLPHTRLLEAPGEEFWPAIQAAFEEYASSRADLVLALRLGPYCELDYDELVQHHLDKHCRMTLAVDAQGASLDTFVLNTGRQSDAMALFRSALQNVRTDCERFICRGYVNRLRDAGDLRCLAVDSLLEKNALHPVGRQVRPGIWMGEAARVHRKARIVAPAFIGPRARVHAAALITRGTAIERGAEVDCGTVVENSTVLPYTYVGAGLDIMHSVVGFRRIVHLARKVEVAVIDRKLVGIRASSSLSRLAGSTAALIGFLPKQIYRGFFAKHGSCETADSPDSLERPAAAFEEPAVRASAFDAKAPEFPSSLAVVRRYGEH